MESENTELAQSPAQLTAPPVFPEEVWFHTRGRRHFLTKQGPECVQVLRWFRAGAGWRVCRVAGERQRLVQVTVTSSVNQCDFTLTARLCIQLSYPSPSVLKVSRAELMTFLQLDPLPMT